MFFLQADATKLPFADKSFDLVFGSPPYTEARKYLENGKDLKIARKPAEWVEWMLDVTCEAIRVSKGLVIWICAGNTKDWCYRPGPEGLLWEAWKAGIQCWRPAYWSRVGIFGSGGKQWLRADVEYALCFTGCEKAIPWANNTANGHPPKWQPGGKPSHRTQTDSRVNGEPKGRRGTRGKSNGDTKQENRYVPPSLANPGNTILGIPVGGGLMGADEAHENEAPFPQKLAEWFIRGWSPPGGKVLDPFSGSGTTVAAATRLGRVGYGSDLRLSQCELGRRRCREIQVDLF